MKNLLMMLAVVVLLGANIATADSFGTGANQFMIDFVDIAGDASSANGTNISQYWPGHPNYREFVDPANDYRMGTLEITNGQFAKFAANTPEWTGNDIPSNITSWYEAAQFVNYLNTSTNNPVAYNFDGGSFGVWQSGDAGYNTDNPYRNDNAFYFLPTEDEWVKAAYWNGASLQTYATTDGYVPIAGTDTNYNQNHPYYGPWDVGSGSEELNGTYDMMGNVWEWMENPLSANDYSDGSKHGLRGGSYSYSGIADYFGLSSRLSSNPDFEHSKIGFRVASVPEPCSVVLLALGGAALRRRKR